METMSFHDASNTCTHMDETQKTILLISPIIPASLSLLSSGWMINNFLEFGKGNGFSKLIACLAWADHFWALSVVIQCILLLLYDPPQVITVSCVILRGLFQVFSGSSIMWTSLIAYYLYVALFCPEQKFIYSDEVWKYFHAIGWGIPLLFFIIVLCVPNSFVIVCYACFPSKILHLALWFVPNMLLFIFCTILYAIIILRFKKDSLLETVSKHRGGLKISHKIFGYVLVFILCWTVEWIIWIVGPVMNRPIPFWSVVIYATLPHAQGLLNAIVYGLSISSLHLHYSKQPMITVIFRLLFSPVLLWIWSLPRWMYRKVNSNKLELSEQQLTQGA